MHRNSLHYLVAVLASVLFTGCVGNGDPRAGGIFWDERKAQHRQHALAEEEHFSWERANRERKTNDALHQQRGSLSARVAEQKREISGDLGYLRRNAADSTIAGEVANLERKQAALANSGDPVEQLEKEVANLRQEVTDLKEQNRLLQRSR